MDNTASLIINIILIVLGCILIIISSIMIDRYKIFKDNAPYRVNERPIGLAASVLVFALIQIIVAIIQLCGKMMELIWDIAMGIFFIVYLVVFSLAVDWNFHEGYNNHVEKAYIAFTAISWIFIFFVLLYVIFLKLKR